MQIEADRAEIEAGAKQQAYVLHLRQCARQNPEYVKELLEPFLATQAFLESQTPLSIGDMVIGMFIDENRSVDQISEATKMAPKYVDRVATASLAIIQATESSTDNSTPNIPLTQNCAKIAESLKDRIEQAWIYQQLNATYPALFADVNALVKIGPTDKISALGLIEFIERSQGWGGRKKELSSTLAEELGYKQTNSVSNLIGGGLQFINRLLLYIGEYRYFNVPQNPRHTQEEKRLWETYTQNAIRFERQQNNLAKSPQGIDEQIQQYLLQQETSRRQSRQWQELSLEIEHEFSVYIPPNTIKAFFHEQRITVRGETQTAFKNHAVTSEARQLLSQNKQHPQRNQELRLAQVIVEDLRQGMSVIETTSRLRLSRNDYAAIIRNLLIGVWEWNDHNRTPGQTAILALLYQYPEFKQLPQEEKFTHLLQMKGNRKHEVILNLGTHLDNFFAVHTHGLTPRQIRLLQTIANPKTAPPATSYESLSPKAAVALLRVWHRKQTHNHWIKNLHQTINNLQPEVAQLCAPEIWQLIQTHKKRIYALGNEDGILPPLSKVHREELRQISQALEKAKLIRKRLNTYLGKPINYRYTTNSE